MKIMVVFIGLIVYISLEQETNFNRIKKCKGFCNVILPLKTLKY